MTQFEQMTQDQLITYLDSDDNQYGLDSIATHGFLTATVVGKPLSNWLSALFDSEDAEGRAVDEPVKQALINWQATILAELKNEQPIALPINQTNNTDNEQIDFSEESDVAVWSLGFVDAMYADSAEDWFAEEATEDDVAMLTLPMIIFSGLDEEDETLQDFRRDEDMLVQMANQLEGNLTELFLLFHTDE